MKVLALAILAAAVIVGAITANPGKTEARQTACLAATPSTATVLADLREMMTATDSESVAARDSLNIPAATETEVVTVQSDSVCAGAAATYRAARGEGSPPRPVWVFELGPLYYAALDPEAKLGEWGHLVIMTRIFVFHDAITW